MLLRLTRRDWGIARELVSRVNLEMADAELRDAEQLERMGDDHSARKN